MKKRILLIVLCFMPVIIITAECSPQKSIEAEWKDSHNIFIGTVIFNQDAPIYNRYGRRVIINNIVVDKVFKGGVTEKDTITMFDSSIEDYKFQEGKQYVIFAYNSCGFLSSSICQRTCPIECANEILNFLKSKPYEEEGSEIYLEAPNQKH